MIEPQPNKEVSNSNSNPIQEKVLFLRSIMSQVLHQQFKDAIQELEQTDANWLVSTLHYLELIAIKVLRDLLEKEHSVIKLSEEEQKDAWRVNWFHPSHTIGVSIPWEFAKGQVNPEIIKTLLGQETKGARVTLTPEEQKTIMADAREFLALQVVSGGVAFAKRSVTDEDNYQEYEYDPVFLPFIDHILKQWPNERNAIVDELRKPFSIYKTWNLTDARTKQPIEIQGTQFHFRVGDTVFEGYIATEFHPLVIDPENEIAFHPITAKILFAEISMGEGKLYKPEPYYWPKELRKTFWDALIGHMEESLEKLQKEPLFPVQKEEQAQQNQQIQQTQKRKKQLIPETMPQQTFMECLSMSKAITDGYRNRYWDKVEGEVTLQHIIPGKPVYTRLTVGPALDWWSLPPTYESLLEQIKQFELSTVLLLHVAINCVLEHRQMTISIDDLCKAIGFTRREAIEKEEAHRKVWSWLLLFDSMTVHGKRPGIYKDRANKKEIDLTSEDAFIKITGKRFDKSKQDTDSKTPIEVTFVAGPWLDQYREDKRILQFFGDIKKIAAISSGRPGGAWAQSIGLALNQFWRQEATDADIRYTGENNNHTVKFKSFTRFQLLELLRCEPWVEDVLNSDNPQRAKQYWKDAIDILTDDPKVKIIGHCRELNELPDKRQNWQAFWLKEQKLDIRPKPNSDSTVAITQLSNTAKKANKNLNLKITQTGYKKRK